MILLYLDIIINSRVRLGEKGAEKKNTFSNDSGAY